MVSFLLSPKLSRMSKRSQYAASGTMNLWTICGRYDIVTFWLEPGKKGPVSLEAQRQCHRSEIGNIRGRSVTDEH